MIQPFNLSAIILQSKIQNNFYGNNIYGMHPSWLYTKKPLIEQFLF